MKVLVTGFEPFGGEKINPSAMVVDALKDRYDDIVVCKCILPTVFGEAIEILEDNIKMHGPDIVICIGQAGGRTEISVERVAINLDDAAIEDNKGNLPIDQTIKQDGANAYFSSLPIKRIVNGLRSKDIPASVSNSAGTFVCNHIMYGLLYLIDKKHHNIRGGFIHVPYIPAQVTNKRGLPHMSFGDILRGIELSIMISSEHRVDYLVSEGSLC